MGFDSISNEETNAEARDSVLYKGRIAESSRQDPTGELHLSLLRYVSRGKKGSAATPPMLKRYAIVQGSHLLAGRQSHHIEIDIASSSPSPTIYVAEGLLSPDTISFLGARMDIRPEVFIDQIGHDALELDTTDINETPAISSPNEHGLTQIHMMSVVRRFATRRDTDLSFARNIATTYTTHCRTVTTAPPASDPFTCVIRTPLQSSKTFPFTSREHKELGSVSTSSVARPFALLTLDSRLPIGQRHR